MNEKGEREKHNNVIVLGAGFSADAGIPLLKDFIQRMIEYNEEIKKPAVDYLGRIREEDKKTLEAALKIRRKLDNYHGRISFDSWNIEDILSMLAFDSKSRKNDLQSFINAIATTIELSCQLRNDGIIMDSNAEIYKEFWNALFLWCKEDTFREVPTIISFNYDLVLEIALMEIVKESFDNSRFPFDSITIDYKYDHFLKQFYDTRYNPHHVPAIRLLKRPKINNGTINILKLHGSLNHPKKDAVETKFLTTPVRDPHIIPPISNKILDPVKDEESEDSEDLWGFAMHRLRNARNVIFVGYSFPRTDVYMQFFLKTALGPNDHINRIYIFDPILWTEEKDAEEMQNRYKECFSEQLRRRIEFKPSMPWSKEIENNMRGKLKHFVALLKDNPDAILF